MFQHSLTFWSLSCLTRVISSRNTTFSICVQRYVYMLSGTNFNPYVFTLETYMIVSNPGNDACVHATKYCAHNSNIHIHTHWSTATDTQLSTVYYTYARLLFTDTNSDIPWAKTINIFRACLGAQLTICAQKWRNFILFSTVSLRFVLSRVCVFLYSLGPVSSIIESDYVSIGRKHIQPVHNLRRHLPAEPGNLRWAVLRDNPHASSVRQRLFHGYVFLLLC